MAATAAQPGATATAPATQAQQPRPSGRSERDEDVDIEDAVKFLSEEMPRIFVTGVVTRSRYSPTIAFQDPISRYSDIDGYCFNISLLTTLFDNKFELLDIAATGPDTVTARWSMEMRARAPRGMPWRPTALITGTTRYGVDGRSGLITSHVDEWDVVSDQRFLSLEAVQYVLRSLTEVRLTPDLETPEYTALLKRSGYEVRSYKPYTVAEAPMPSGAGPASGAGFMELAGYIFGGNDAGESMEMTTPVLSSAGQRGGGGDGEGGARMAFVMERRFTPEQLPRARSGQVSARVEPPRIRAAVTFGGFPLDFEVERAERELRAALVRDGLQPEAGYLLARYNEPTVPPWLRRNEVLITLRDFQLPQL